jgi:carbamoyl-phosphate synthase large subunit
MNLLFTNIGRRTYLLEYALELQQRYDLKIFVCDTSEITAGFWVSDKIKKFITPCVSDDEEYYIKKLFKKCQEYKIDVIIPLMDFELPILAKNKLLFAQNGIKIIISDSEVIETCLDKEKTYHFCQKNDINMPLSYFSYPSNAPEFPLVLKKIKGSGSVGQFIISNIQELQVLYKEGYLLQQQIEGIEYGMDVFNDLQGHFLHAAFRKKYLMRAGETDKAVSVYSDQLLSIARIISEKFLHVGNMDVDVVIDKNNNYYCIDFNPRFGGGYPLTHLSGSNYLEYIIRMVLGQTVTTPREYKENIVMVKGISAYTFNSQK